jgi:hypothetical protein
MKKSRLPLEILTDAEQALLDAPRELLLDGTFDVVTRQSFVLGEGGPELLVAPRDQNGIELGLFRPPLALTGADQRLGVGGRLGFVDSLVLVAVGLAQRHQQPLEVPRRVTLQVGF